MTALLTVGIAALAIAGVQAGAAAIAVVVGLLVLIVPAIFLLNRHAAREREEET